jgi:hypothetical protein
MPQILEYSKMSVDNYDATLKGWANLAAVPKGITFGVLGLKYCNASTERDKLIKEKGWKIEGDSKLGSDYILNNKTVVYNKQPHDIKLNTTPNAPLAVKYEIYDSSNKEIPEAINIGEYTVKAIISGCGADEIKKATLSITSVLKVTTSKTDVSCNGGSDGTASVSVLGGTTPYRYVWSTGATTQSITGLAEGTYTVTAIDANNYASTETFTVIQPTALTATTSKTDVSCNGGSNGTASVNVSGGTGNYTYLWSPSGGTAATATGLTAGTYTVTITDANSCTTKASVTIEQPTALTATASQTNISCNGGSNGSATVTPSGGTGGYTYSWFPSGGTGATATGLPAGNYTVTVTDANACVITRTFTIIQPTALTVTTSQTNVSCNGGSNGTATVIPSGGAGGYTYSWAPSGGTAASATGLVAGTYTVTVTDANACAITRTFTITEPNVVQTPKVTSSSVNYKYGDSATALVATNDANHTLKWYEGDNKTLLTKVPIPITNKIGKQTYWVSQVNSTECESELVKIEVTITPTNLTVTADAKTKVYGSVDPVLTYKVLGLVNAEKESDVLAGSLSRVPGENVGSYAITQGDLKASSNYTLDFKTNNLEITPATLTVTADAKTKVYGSVDPILTYKVTGLVNNDALTGSLSRVLGEDVGSYAISQGTLVANGNYTMTFTRSNLTITPASLTVTADAQSKVYGSVDPTLTYKVTGLVNNDALTGSLSRVLGEDVGSYAITQGTLVANGNYMMTFAGNNLTITPAALTVTADTQSKIYGSVDPVLTYKVSGLVNAEKESDVLVGSLTRIAGESVGTYIINQGTLVANGNYTMTFAGNNLTITPANLIVTADAKTKVYGSADPVLTYKVTGLVNRDKESDVLSGNLSRDKGENVGLYIINQGALLANANYSLAFNKAELIITKAPIMGVKLEDASYVYDSQEKELLISGNLPKDAKVSYVSNKQTEAGVYEVTALVTVPNYIDLPLKAKLTISKAAITGVKLEDASYVYDSHEKALLISGNLPKDAKVSYVSNKQIKAGVYEVTALVSAPNYIDLPLKAKLTISKAKQEITFNKLTPIVFNKNIQLQLTASSNSGLPVSYTYSYEGSKAAAIVSPLGTVTVVSPGRIVITVHQVGDNNYAPAKSISQALVIINDEALITDWKINGQRQGALSSIGMFRQDCNEITDQMNIELETSVGAEVSTGSKFTILTPKTGIYRQEVVVTSQSGSTTKKYEIVIERPFGFDDIVIQKFDNTLLVNNNPQTNGGYRFIGYRWYKNDQLIGTEQVYSVGNKKEDLLDLNALYRVELVTDKGEVLHSCASTIRYTHTKNIQLYPNPVVKNGVLEVAIDYPSTALDQMSASVYSLTGQFLFTVPLQGAVSKVNLPSNMVEGVYIMLIKIEGKTKTLRFMVKP